MKKLILLLLFAFSSILAFAKSDFLNSQYSSDVITPIIKKSNIQQTSYIANKNWGGINFLNRNGVFDSLRNSNNYLNLGMKFVVPRFSKGTECDSSNKNVNSIWVGASGSSIRSNEGLLQAGIIINVNCATNAVSILPFYEGYPNPAYTISNFKIRQGDTIQVDINYSGKGASNPIAYAVWNNFTTFKQIKSPNFSVPKNSLWTPSGEVVYEASRVPSKISGVKNEISKIARFTPFQSQVFITKIFKNYSDPNIIYNFNLLDYNYDIFNLYSASNALKVNANVLNNGFVQFNYYD